MSARSLNKVMLIGNLTRDPNLRYTPNNTPVCSFGLATNRDWVTEGGEKQDRVEFHNVVAWSKLAEICGQLLHKGDKVYVDGRLQTRDWKGDDGQTRRTTEVVIENMILLRSSQGGGSRNSEMSDEYFPADEAGSEAPLADDLPADEVSTTATATADADEDIPF